MLGASLSAGFRWTCTQLLLTSRSPPAGAEAADASASQRHGRSIPYWKGLSALTLLYYSSPFGCIALFPLALAIEARPLVAYASVRGTGALIGAVSLSTVGAALAFVLIFAELRVVQLSSGLTLSVAGIFKEVLTVAASAVFLGDRLTIYNVTGLCLCLVGIGLYNRMQLRKMQAAASDEAAPTSESLRHVQQIDR